MEFCCMKFIPSQFEDPSFETFQGGMPPYPLLMVSAHTIVPQLSKCPKFEAVWGVLTDQMIWIWTKRYNKTHECIVVNRMAPHYHLIDWYYLLPSFVQLMVIESLKSFT